MNPESATPQSTVGRPALAPADCFHAHKAIVYRWASAHGLGHEQALDVVQETYLRLLHAGPAFANESAQLGWLRRVATNLAVETFRRARRAPALRLVGEPADEARAPDLDPNLNRDRLAGAMAGLSEMQRLVILMKTVDGLTFAAIAADLGLATPTAKTHYLRGLQSLRDRLGAPSPAPKGVQS